MSFIQSISSCTWYALSIQLNQLLVLALPTDLIHLVVTFKLSETNHHNTEKQSVSFFFPRKKAYFKSGSIGFSLSTDIIERTRREWWVEWKQPWIEIGALPNSPTNSPVDHNNFLFCCGGLWESQEERTDFLKAGCEANWCLNLGRSYQKQQENQKKTMNFIMKQYSDTERLVLIRQDGRKTKKTVTIYTPGAITRLKTSIALSFIFTPSSP